MPAYSVSVVTAIGSEALLSLIAQTLLANDVRLDLRSAVDAAAALQPIAVTPAVHEQV